MTTESNHPKLVITVSSTALFAQDESTRIFDDEGLPAYIEHQISHEDEPFAMGTAFYSIQKLLNLNEDAQKHVEVILISRNSADSGLRVFNSIHHYGLDITRAVFTNGRPPWSYLAAFESDLFLSTNVDDVRTAIEKNFAAATLPHQAARPQPHDQFRVAFDCDSVIFSDAAERIHQDQGIKPFAINEQQKAHIPLEPGPFKNFLQKIAYLQNHYPATDNPIRTAIITARSAPAHKRVIHTLRSWNIRIDESIFLGGYKKSAFIASFNADIFFDDTIGHCRESEHITAAGHVPYGIINEQDASDDVSD